MASDSQANAKRKRLAANKLDRRALKKSKKADQTDIAYGMPSELGSGSQIGSAKNDVSEKSKGE